MTRHMAPNDSTNTNGPANSSDNFSEVSQDTFDDLFGGQTISMQDEPDQQPAPQPAPSRPAPAQHAPRTSGTNVTPASTSASGNTPQFNFDDVPKRKNILSNLLIVVGVLLLLVAGGIYAYNQWNYHKIDESNERVAEYARLSEDDGMPPEVDWEALKAMNPDVVGWLEVPGTTVNYPVFQAGDNDYYLHRAPDRSDSIGGSVFLDFENTPPGMVDAQTIIYGHHMRNGSQFKQIADMDSQELFNGVKTVWYVTEQGAYNLAPFFLYYTNENDIDVRQFEFESLDAFHAYLGSNLARAVTRRDDADQIVMSATHVLTLSTCNYYDGYGRTILVCVPKTEIPGTPEYEQAQAAAAAAAEAAAAAAAQEPAVASEPEPVPEPVPDPVVTE